MDQFGNLSDYYIWTPDGTEKFWNEIESVDIQNYLEIKSYFSVTVNNVTLQTLSLKL